LLAKFSNVPVNETLCKPSAIPRYRFERVSLSFFQAMNRKPTRLHAYADGNMVRPEHDRARCVYTTCFVVEIFRNGLKTPYDGLLTLLVPFDREPNRGDHILRPVKQPSAKAVVLRKREDVTFFLGDGIHGDALSPELRQQPLLSREHFPNFILLFIPRAGNFRHQRPIVVLAAIENWRAMNIADLAKLQDISDISNLFGRKQRFHFFSMVTKWPCGCESSELALKQANPPIV